MSARAPKIMGARALKNNGCAPPFFKRAFHEPFFFHDSFLHLFTRSPFDCSLNNECSCPSGKWVLEPSKRWVLEPPKIMGARPHFFKRAFHEPMLLEIFTLSRTRDDWVKATTLCYGSSCRGFQPNRPSHAAQIGTRRTGTG